jgi:NADH-quinone oxidoreductase subunit H
MTLTVGLLIWVFLPFSPTHFITNFDFSILLVYAFSSFGAYGIILAGWASNSKYAFLGALRSAAQLISYEVSLGLIILPVVLCAGSFNLIEIVSQQIGSV